MDGVPVGVAFAYVDPHRTDGKGMMSGPHVPPELRRRGVGTALALAVFADLVSRGMSQAEVQELDRTDINGFLEALGFKPVRIFSKMRRSLSSLTQGIGESTDTEVVAVEPTPEVLKTVIAIEGEAFKDHFSYRPLTLPELEFTIRTEAEEGTVTQISLASIAGRPVGYLWYGFDPKGNAHLKRSRGGLWDIGVLKPWRNRGIAKAPMLAAMRHLQREGIDEVDLHVDDTNVTGANHLYKRLGFTLVHREIVRRKGLGLTGRWEK